MSQTIHKFIRQAAVWVTVLVVCLSTMAKPFFAVPAEAAYHQTYIQTTIDVSNWDILGGVVDVKSGGFFGASAPLEYSRIGGDVLGSLAGTETPSGAASYITNEPNGGGGSKEKNLVLTFPGSSKADGPSLVHTESTDRDSARAGLILNSLLFDLNAAFKFVYGDASGFYTPDGADLDEKVEQYRTDMQNLLRAVPSGNVNGAAITNSSGDITSFVDNTVTASDYITITKNDTFHPATEDIGDTIGNKEVFDAAMKIIQDEMSWEEQLVLQRFMSGQPQSVTAKELGASQAKVSKIQKIAIAKLTLAMKERNLGPAAS